MDMATGETPRMRTTTTRIDKDDTDNEDDGKE